MQVSPSIETLEVRLCPRSRRNCSIKCGKTIRLKHYLPGRPKKPYVSWIRRFILFHGKKHPQQMGKREIEAFPSHLAVDRNVAASTRLKPHLLINAGADTVR